MERANINLPVFAQFVVCNLREKFKVVLYPKKNNNRIQSQPRCGRKLINYSNINNAHQFSSWFDLNTLTQHSLGFRLYHLGKYWKDNYVPDRKARARVCVYAVYASINLSKPIVIQRQRMMTHGFYSFLLKLIAISNKCSPIAHHANSVVIVRTSCAEKIARPEN